MYNTTAQLGCHLKNQTFLVAHRVSRCRKKRPGGNTLIETSTPQVQISVVCMYIYAACLPVSCFDALLSGHVVGQGQVFCAGSNIPPASLPFGLDKSSSQSTRTLTIVWRRARSGGLASAQLFQATNPCFTQPSLHKVLWHAPEWTAAQAIIGGYWPACRLTLPGMAW